MWPLQNLKNSFEKRSPHSDVYHYISTDYMMPLRLLHFSNFPQGLLTKQRIKLNVFGLIDTSRHVRTYTTHFDFWPHDWNVYLSLLFYHLYSVRKGGNLSNTLILNCDNSFKDNKNQFVLAFLLISIQKDWYKMIEFHFLMPGHSH
eukprot:TRINITY_DN4405_c0_g1_i14.p1 TRINITY_DN4405_c0_g1~~TRINITY_DN4405_c0_g1_i14.p1  ORF type:complete len:146 (+),score=12.75 TRINITY_DN4405_c0_g1_i14:681-1118(+)